MKKILCLSIHYPLTMARYFENNFRAREDVEFVTVGPYTGANIPWMGGMTLDAKYANQPDIILPFAPNVGEVPFAMVRGVRDVKWDMVLTIDAGIRWKDRPNVDCPVVHIATDPHVINYDKPRAYSDFFFNMQKCYSKENDIYLPYAYDDTWCYPEPEVAKTHDCSLIGMPYQERVVWVNKLRENGYTVLFENGPIFDQYRSISAKSVIGLNWSSKDDLVCRVFEIMGMGLVPVINRVPDLSEHFVENFHYLGFSSLDEAIEKVRWAENFPLDAKIIADHALEIVQERHTFRHRVQQIMDAVFWEDKLLHELGY